MTEYNADCLSSDNQEAYKFRPTLFQSIVGLQRDN